MIRQPTAVGAGRSAGAVHAASRLWFSFFRQATLHLMHRITATFLLSMLTLGVGSCAYQPLPQASSPDYSKFVHVAAIDSKMADHVGKVLERAGIQCIIEGSVAYGVSVPPGTESRATSLLRADSVVQKYWIQFP